jgi:hypothetical protein
MHSFCDLLTFIFVPGHSSGKEILHGQRTQTDRFTRRK